MPEPTLADVSTLSQIANIVNGATPVTPGSTITVAPGTYDTRSLAFTGQPSNVRWQAADPGNRPVFTGWKIAPTNFASTGGHLQFGNINFDMPLPALGPAGSATGAIFWSPLPSTLHSMILGAGSSLDALTIEDFDATGNMLPWHLGGRMTHNNPFMSLSGAKNVTIRRGTIRRNRAGVEINGVSGLLIEDVHFTEQHTDPIALQNGVGHCENIVVRNNHFTLPSGDTANHHSDIIQLQPIAGPYQIRNVDIQGNTASALVPVLCAQLDPTHTQVFPSLQGVSAASGNQTITLPTSPANGTIWAYMRTDASANTCVVVPGGTNTLSSGASQALAQNNVVIFTYSSGTGQWAVEVTGQTFGQVVAARWHAQEIRLAVGTTSFTIDLPAASDGMRQYLFRCNVAGGGTVTFTLAGSDTYSEGALPIVTAAGQAPTFVSNGTSQWSPLPLGYRAWFVQRNGSFTLGNNERDLVTKLNATNGNLTATLPANGSGVYHIGREDGSANVCKVIASGGNTITYNGAPVTEVALVQGYGFDITGDGAGGWTVFEQTPTYTFMFGNSGNYDNFRCFGNIGLVFGDFYRAEVAFKQAVFNNTVLRLALDDANGDGVIGRYENNSGSQQNVIQLSGADAYGERNFGTGYISLGGYGPFGGGAAVPGKIKNNLMLATANSNDIVTALAPYLNGTDRTFYRPLSRSEVVAVARAKAGGALDGTFIGASGTNDTNGFYNFAVGQVNTGILPRPAVATTSPLAGATVGLDQSFQFTFDTFIKAGTGNVTLWNATDGVAVETFNVATGAGSAGGTIVFTIDGFTIDPSENLAGGKTYHVRIESSAIVGQSYGTTYAGVADGTFAFVADSGVVTAYTPLTADKGAYLTRTGAINANAAIKKAVFAFEARLVPNANAIHSLFIVDRTQDFNASIVQSSGELRMTYGASSWRVASAVPVSGTTRKRIIMTVDTTQATIADGVKVYIDGALATLTSTAWTQNTALVGTDAATVVRAMMGANSVFNGEVAFIYFDALADGAPLPNLADAAVRAKFDPGQIGANGQGPTGSVPLFYKTGDRAAWEAANNLGTLSSFAKTGSFL
ncbi:Ig-like domain-containing protein [Sphingomonas turrisvirgatae]|uniref:Ig-like domain-containing protein n=1 Tax=Sphingomonas turrisvirgatae TaxID=1888892 RepID=UPI0013013922|nr:Ig-like domain-containing protein [Sphingomonas turrisvirgatae]